MCKKILIGCLFSIYLTGCMKTVQYYTADDSSIAFENDTCHGYTAELKPIKDDNNISSSLRVWHSNVSQRHTLGIDLTLRPSPGTEFKLIDKNIRISLPSGQDRSVEFVQLPRGLNVILEGHSVEFVKDPSGMWTVRQKSKIPGEYVTDYPAFTLSGEFEFQASVPKALTVYTPSFSVNGKAYPSRVVPIHLEKSTRLDLCEA